MCDFFLFGCRLGGGKGGEGIVGKHYTKKTVDLNTPGRAQSWSSSCIRGAAKCRCSRCRCRLKEKENEKRHVTKARRLTTRPPRRTLAQTPRTTRTNPSLAGLTRYVYIYTYIYIYIQICIDRQIERKIHRYNPYGLLILFLGPPDQGRGGPHAERVICISLYIHRCIYLRDHFRFLCSPGPPDQGRGRSNTERIPPDAERSAGRWNHPSSREGAAARLRLSPRHSL